MWDNWLFFALQTPYELCWASDWRDWKHMENWKNVRLLSNISHGGIFLLLKIHFEKLHGMCHFFIYSMASPQVEVNSELHLGFGDGHSHRHVKIIVCSQPLPAVHCMQYHLHIPRRKNIYLRTKQICDLKNCIFLIGIFTIQIASRFWMKMKMLNYLVSVTVLQVV